MITSVNPLLLDSENVVRQYFLTRRTNLLGSTSDARYDNTFHKVYRQKIAVKYRDCSRYSHDTLFYRVLDTMRPIFEVESLNDPRH